MFIGLIIAIVIIAVLFVFVLSNTQQHPSITQYSIKGRDVALEESMNALTTNSLIYYASHGNYGAFCNDSATKNIYNSIVSENKYCYQDNSRWVVCARLSEDNTKAWCVDYNGVKKQIDDGACKNGLFACP